MKQLCTNGVIRKEHNGVIENNNIGREKIVIDI